MCVCVLSRGDTDPSDPGDGDECAIVGSEALSRLTGALRGEVVLGIAVPLVKSLLGQPSADGAAPMPRAGLWQGKRAALVGLGFMAAGARACPHPSPPPHAPPTCPCCTLTARGRRRLTEGNEEGLTGVHEPHLVVPV